MSEQTLTCVVLISVLTFFVAAHLTSPPHPPFPKRRKSKLQESWAIALYLTSGLCFYITIAVSVVAAVLTITK